MSGAREGAVELLSPVGDVAGRAVAVDHLEGLFADIGELVEDAGGNVDGLPAGDRLALLAEAHFAGAAENIVDFLLLLIVPGDLAAARIEGDVAEGEIGGLDRGDAANQVLSAATGGVAAAGELG